MNSRIFKKITKAASVEIERLKPFREYKRFEVDHKNQSIDIAKRFKWERKSLDESLIFPNIYVGTIGYGATSGYYEPEWEENDALSLLFEYVFQRFTDWDSFDYEGGGWPDNDCPPILKKSARHLINYTKQLTKP